MPSELETICALAQGYLSKAPTLVIGSGASAAYGVGGMDTIRDHLLGIDGTAVPGASPDLWGTFAGALRQEGLEGALDAVTLADDTVQWLVSKVRARIVDGDRQVFAKLIVGNKSVLHLGRLFRHLFQSTVRRISVVTTNYDNLCEYAADMSGYTFNVGFPRGHIRLWDSGDSQAPVQRPNRLVDVWKVHGSIDWYINGKGEVLSLDSQSVPDGLSPLIITPGTSKYLRSHEEPFRTILASADQCLSESAAYLCVGYGFRDRHIEPKLVQRIRQGTPIMVLAKNLTPQARTLVLNGQCRNYLVVECSPSNQANSIAYFPGHDEGVEVPERCLWDLGGLLDSVL